ncbi:Extradiol aromatic ring-opening dioxygenase [Periconia macrospinosa]|uniref:Extradiol aromatic ring-opening dioxygenase n=1 Tax=Periconia macrospinosa TaxID=97972 RepID=A0A2V1DGF4_9PLEO|nr:Extradiol aromatic ring-opening dioxygenase [Periconia macrospinosa]
MTDSTPRLAPVICISHGGGPMPVLGDPGHTAIVKSLKTRVPKILKLNTPEQPRAIVLVTAHWQTADVTISSGEKHPLYYDYGGFPKEAYSLKYDAPGSPEVAEEVRKALEKEGVRSVADGKRGWDHGVFVPMMLIHPAANIPIVQVSVLSSESPSAHFAYGRALSSLRAQNIAIVGSGFASFHNLGLMFSGAARSPDFKRLNEAWNDAVKDAASTQDETQRKEKFEKWRTWPSAYKMHPNGGAEHFLPLVVCAGAGRGAAKSYSDEFMGLKMWSFYWE